ncbi:spermidine synthase [Anthonomus grandis grandis]|uniref:spermidine synthase n=1 Tax=Anthonomus grandis grandis TaxID=2921223 RepID=UPI002165F906|nr:spermidine synthase [Anthonomus grandis grandis]
MDQIRQGWYSEMCELWPGQSFSLEVKEVLFHGKSEFQDVLIVQTTNHGRALILDGIIQCTEFDEFSYQEMISFLPLCAHKNPKNVLIVGGGDGGVAREVAKHPSVEQFVQVEIDAMVIEQSKKFLPFMAKGFESPKLTLIVGDGFEYMKNHQNKFDVIITDSSDPIGPAVNLFTENYFKLLKDALRPNGIICSQAGTLWSDLPHVKETIENCQKHFPVVKYAVSSVPSYPNGQIGYLVASLDETVNLTKPVHTFAKESVEELQLRYYNDKIHEAAFVLPNCFNKALWN